MFGHTLQQGFFLVEFFFPVNRLGVSGLFDAATLVPLGCMEIRGSDHIEIARSGTSKASGAPSPAATTVRICTAQLDSNVSKILIVSKKKTYMID